MSSFKRNAIEFLIDYLKALAAVTVFAVICVLLVLFMMEFGLQNYHLHNCHQLANGAYYCQ